MVQMKLRILLEEKLSLLSFGDLNNKNFKKLMSDTLDVENYFVMRERFDFKTLLLLNMF